MDAQLAQDFIRPKKSCYTRLLQTCLVNGNKAKEFVDMIRFALLLCKPSCSGCVKII